MVVTRKAAERPNLEKLRPKSDSQRGKIPWFVLLSGPYGEGKKSRVLCLLFWWADYSM